MSSAYVLSNSGIQVAGIFDHCLFLACPGNYVDICIWELGPSRE